MRKIFPSKHAPSGTNGNPPPPKHPGKKEKSPVLSGDSSKTKYKPHHDKVSPPDAFRKLSAKQSSAGSSYSEELRDANSTVSRGKREHWCPTCPTGTEFRCETPPSGDENVLAPKDDCCSSEADSGKQASVWHFGLGLPEECQDKQILRPSMKARSRSPSPEPIEWTNGLQAALDQLVTESRQELRRKYVSEPPSAASSPPLVDKRSHGKDREEIDGRPGSALSVRHQHVRQKSMRLLTAPEVEVCSAPPVNLEENEAAMPAPSLSHSMDFESRTSFGASGRFSRSLSRSSNDGPSIMSNPRSQSFSDWSRGARTSDNFSYQEVSADGISRDRSHFKYLSARAVAERLAKAIRGNSKPKDAKRPPIPHTPTRSSESSSAHSTSKFGRAIAQASEESSISHQTFGSSNRLTGKVETDRSQKKLEVVQHKQEKDFFRRQLESHSAQISFVYDTLEERASSAEELFAVAEAELNSSDGVQVERNTGRLSSRELERHEALHRKLKKLQKDKKELAREVVSEVRLRSMERVTVREVVEYMKRDMEFWIKSLERDKSEMHNRLEQLEKKGDDCWLRERVQKLSEEKDWLEKELVSVTSKESTLRQKVREFELQMQAHVARVEDAERTILELRESLVTGQKKLMQSEEEGERLRKAYKDKERDNLDLRKLVGRLQQLCSDHEKSIQGLWQSLRSISHDKSDQKVAKLQQELLRLSDVEQTLRREVEASRVEASGLRNELQNLAEKETTGIMDEQVEAGRLKARLVTLQEHVSLLSNKLNTSIHYQKRQQEEIKALESVKSSLEEENKDLWEKFEQGKKDLHCSEKRVEVVQKTRCEIQQLEFSREVVEETGHLYEEKCASGKQELIQGLQQSLSDMTHALNTQNGRIQRLTGRNEELCRLYNAKERELLEIQTRLREDNENKKASEVELELGQVKDRLKFLQEELQAQQLHCKVLREKLSGKEMELEQCRGDVADVAQSRHVLQEEVSHLRRLLESSTPKVADLEHQVKEREQKLSLLHADLRQCVQELGRYKEEMPRVIRQRDGIKQEAEQLGREALRMSAEAEVLRRRVHQLEEDVMLKEGQLSILRGSLNDED